MNDSPIFIVGCARSGTALLRDLLRSHPRLTFPGESHFIPALYRGYGDPKNEREACALAARILGTSWVKAWSLSLDPSAFAGDRSFAQVVARLYEAWAEKEHKPRWGDKTPRYVLEIPLLVKLFPDAKILHIIRDGRDVTLSWLRVGFGPLNVYTAAQDWREMVQAGRRDGAALGGEKCLEVRYESLLSEPDATMRKVCAFIEEPFTEAVLRPSPLEPGHYSAPIIGKPLSGRRRPNEIVRDNAGKWKKAMTPSRRALFESIAGDLLRELGYETERRARSISTLERWLWRTHHRLRWMLRRLNRKDYFGEVREALVKHGSILAHRLRAKLTDVRKPR